MMISRILCMVALLVSVRGVPANQLPDFTGASIVERGFCTVDGDVIECMEVQKEKELFVVFHQGYQIFFIFKVKEGATKPYQPDMLEQIFPPKGTAI